MPNVDIRRRLVPFGLVIIVHTARLSHRSMQLSSGKILGCTTSPLMSTTCCAVEEREIYSSAVVNAIMDCCFVVQNIGRNDRCILYHSWTCDGIHRLRSMYQRNLGGGMWSVARLNVVDMWCHCMRYVLSISSLISLHANTWQWASEWNFIIFFVMSDRPGCVLSLRYWRSSSNRLDFFFLQSYYCQVYRACVAPRWSCMVFLAHWHTEYRPLWVWCA